VGNAHYALLAAYSNRKDRSCQCILKNSLAKRAYMKRSDFIRPDFAGCAPHTIFKVGRQSPPYIHRQPNASSSLGIKKLSSLSEVEGCRNLLFSFFLPDRPFPARPRLAFSRSLHRWPYSVLGFTLVAGNQLCETVGRLRSFLFHSELLN
jgi:hypothetical protein